MKTQIIANFEKLIDTPRDNALLRYTLGNEWLKAGDPAQARIYLAEATRKDPRFTAAWKLLGKACQALGEPGEAMAAYRQGIEVAEARGDLQAAKEMSVFLKRLEKTGQNIR